jgi:hypothetical protein
MAACTAAARSARDCSSVIFSAWRAAAVFRPENEKSQSLRPSRARGSSNLDGSPVAASFSRPARPDRAGPTTWRSCRRPRRPRRRWWCPGGCRLRPRRLPAAGSVRRRPAGAGRDRDVGAQPGRDRVAFQVVDRDQRHVASQRHGLAERQADHHAADQAGAGRGGDAVQVLERQARGAHGLGGDGVDGFHVGAGGDLGHHAAERGMLLELRADDRGQHADRPVRRAAHDRGRGLVAAGLQAKDGQTCRVWHSVAGFPPVL